MRHLHVIGFTSDHGGLILAGKRGAQTGSYILALDEHVLAQIEQARQAAGEEAPVPVARPVRSHEQSGLTPREIQARLRAGRTVEEVAAEAGVSIDWVDRFAAPVLAEQGAAVARAQAATLQTARRGASDRTLAASVLRNLAERGVTLTSNEVEAGWSARHMVDGEWLVTFRFRSRGRMLAAEWILAGTGSSVTARNRLATELGFVEAGRSATVPAEAAAAPAAVRPARNAPVARAVPVAKRAAASAAAKARKAPVARKAPMAERTSAARAGAGARTTGRERAAAPKAPAARRVPVGKVVATTRAVPPVGSVGKRSAAATKKVAGSQTATRTAAAQATPTQATAGRKVAAAKAPGPSGQARKLVPAKVLVSRKAAVDRPVPVAAAATTGTPARKVTVKAVPVKATAVKATAVRATAVRATAVKAPAAPARPAAEPKSAAAPKPASEPGPAGVPGDSAPAGLAVGSTGSQGAVPTATPSGSAPAPSVPAPSVPARPVPGRPVPARSGPARERPLRANRPLRAERPAPAPAPAAVEAGPDEAVAQPDTTADSEPIGRHFARPRPDATGEAPTHGDEDGVETGPPPAADNGSGPPRLNRLGRRAGRPLRANRTEPVAAPDEEQPAVAASLPVTAEHPVVGRPLPERPLLDRPASDRNGPERTGDASPWAGPVPSGRPVIRAQPVTGDVHRGIDPPGDDRFRPSP